MGYDLPHPHFVGTLDAFLLRYVILPFLPKVFASHKKPRLIPADWKPAYWTRRPDGQEWEHQGCGGESAKRYRLFNVCYVDEVDDRPIMKYRNLHAGKLDDIANQDLDGLREAKKRAWMTLGWVSHSDAALLASYVLRSRRFGAVVRELLARRFPLLIVDELQDTGFFLGMCILTLLQHQGIRGVLVGDPDQAIFEFNGARPDLFKRFQAIAGAATLPLANSRRCPTAIAAAACHLKQSGDSFGPASDRRGRALLVEYNVMKDDVEAVVRTLAACWPGATVKIAARLNATIVRLTGCKAAHDKVNLWCAELNHLRRAVILFRQGQQAAALAASRACIDRAALGHEGASDDMLVGKGIEPAAWKALAVRILLGCDAIHTDGTLFDWQTEAGSLVAQEVLALGLNQELPGKTGSLKPQKRPGWDKAARECLPSPSRSVTATTGLPIQTVHSVKGETHDVTVLVCPEPDRAGARCPSEVWWSTSGPDLEERRIAYVAMTRSRGDLVVCVSGRTMRALKKNRAPFYKSFEPCLARDFAVTYGMRE